MIGAALAGAGHRLVGITAGSDPDRAAAVLPGLTVMAAPDLVRASQLVVLAVPHDQLPGLAAGLAEVGAWQPGQLVLHTDPAYGTDVLEPAVRSGAIPLAVHPAISFTGTTLDLRQLQASYAGVTAPPMVLPIAQALAVELGCEPVVIDEADRPAYAEAIATASRVRALDRRPGHRDPPWHRRGEPRGLPLGPGLVDLRPGAARGVARRTRGTASCATRLRTDLLSRPRSSGRL